MVSCCRMMALVTCWAFKAGSRNKLNHIVIIILYIFLSSRIDFACTNLTVLFDL